MDNLFRTISALARNNNPEQFSSDVSGTDAVNRVVSRLARDTAANSIKYTPARVLGGAQGQLITDILSLNEAIKNYKKDVNTREERSAKEAKKTYTTDGPQSSTTDGAIFDKWYDENKRNNQTTSQTPETTQEDDTEIIEYTYQPGDTFGQVLLNLGLSDGSDLWTPGGAVDYYTEQLHDQGIWGNVPIGTTIRLKRRK